MSFKTSTPTGRKPPAKPATPTRRRPRWRRWLTPTIGLALGAGLLALVARSVDADALRRSLGALDTRALLPALGVSVLQLPLRPWRWRTAFPPGTVGFRACFETLAIGNLVNYLIPGRGGDLLRCVLVRRRAPVTSVSLALGTLGVEKLLDGMALVAILGVAGWLLPLPLWLGRLTAGAAAVFLAALVALALLHTRTAGIATFLGRRSGDQFASRLARRGAGFVEQFAQGLAAMGSRRRFALMALQTVLIVVGEAATLWLLAHALGVDLAPAAVAIVVAVLGLGFMLPAAPGFVGTYEALGVATLALFGVATAPAAAVTVLTHAWSFVWIAAVGAVGLAMGGLSLGEIFRASDR